MSTTTTIKRRRARARRLRAEGLSVRQIAAKLGVGVSTAHRDVQAEDGGGAELAPVPNIQDEDGRPVAGAEAGNDRALQHGCYSPATLAPRAEEIADTLREALGPAYGPHVAPAVQLAALALARLEAAQRWLDEHGLVSESGKLRPLTKSVSSFQAEARRALESLALTPREWAKLGLDNVRGAALAEHLRRKHGVGGDR